MMDRRSIGFAAALAMVSGCQEYAIYNANGGAGAGDAPTLETPRQQDVITQTTIPEVDILWVVDNSCSMADEQARLSSNFGSFIQFFVNSGLDWHIGVVSTDTAASGHSGKLQRSPTAGSRFLSSEMDDNVVIAGFQEMVDLGTNGSADEKGIRAAWLALSMPSADLQSTNAGFYRDGASLHIVTITDEDDYGAVPSRGEFINYLQTLKPRSEIPVTYSSIVGPAPNGCNGGSYNNGADHGAEYLAVTAAIGGITESICATDWQPVLEELGLQAAGLKTEYFLTEVPVPGTVEVWVVDGGVEYNGIDLDRKPSEPTIRQYCNFLKHDECFGFTFDSRRNSIVMTDFLPSPLATVHIDYELLSGFVDPAIDAEEDTDE